ncbi:MAG: NAD(P)-dependent oxidoreductase [Suipraeoptans sp.]
MRIIGFIGLGNMGYHMVKNLLAKDYEVHVYDISKKALDEAKKIGAVPENSLADLSRKTDTIFVMVMNYQQVKSVVLGEEGVFANANENMTIVVSSTISPEETRELAEIAMSYKINYMDCPVSGGKDGAINGTLIMMAACEESVFASNKDILFAVGSNTYHVSEKIGNGQVMKSINQVMIATGMAIASEAVTMAVKSGLKPDQIYEVITKCTGCSDVFRDKLPLIMKRDFVPRGPIDIFIKDLSIALDIGKDVKSPMFVSSTVKQIFTWASAEGYGQEDLGALIRAYEDSAGVTVEK